MSRESMPPNLEQEYKLVVDKHGSTLHDVKRWSAWLLTNDVVESEVEALQVVEFLLEHNERTLLDYPETYSDDGVTIKVVKAQEGRPYNMQDLLRLYVSLGADEVLLAEAIEYLQELLPSSSESYYSHARLQSYRLQKLVELIETAKHRNPEAGSEELLEQSQDVMNRLE